MQVFTKNEYAFLSIRDDILNGTLPGGTKLNINDLAERYNVSAMPIRNAIAKLEELGYIRTVPHIGSWVCEFDFDSYFTNMLLRADAEALAARAVALKHDEKLIADMHEFIAQMRAAKEAGNFEEYGKVNRKFHSLLCNACNIPPLIESIQSLVSRTHISVNIFSWLPTSSDDSLKEHELLYKSIVEGDACKSAACIAYQRCRSNLALLHYMKTTRPEDIAIDMLKTALAQEGMAEKLDYYIALFETSKQSHLKNLS